MPPHIDLYPAEDAYGKPGHWGEPRRLYEGEPATNYASWKELPDFNGYTFMTAVHEDEECSLHRPEDPVWTPARTSDIRAQSNDTEIA